MAYTFASATDDITYTGQLASAQDNCATLVTMWVYPSPLTAGRNYWGIGTTGRIYCAVAPTTSEIEVGTQNNTTDGQWRTTGCGMVADQWQFLAVFLATEHTTVPGQCRVWRGTEWEPPVAPTITNNQVRSGNYSGSTTRVIGNESASGALAIQGDIAGYTHLVTNVVGVNNGMVVATSGTLSAAEEALLYQRWVYPLWNGRAEHWRMRPVTLGGGFELSYAPLTEDGRIYTYSHVGVVTAETPTVNGATLTANNPSRLPPADWVQRFFGRPPGRRRMR